MRRLRPALSIALALAAATPAAADPTDDRPIPVIGKGVATITYEAAYNRFKVCAQGTVPPTTRVAGQWTLAIEGHRETVPFTVPTWSSTAFSVSRCTYVSRASDNGSMHVSFSYTAAGNYALVWSVHSVVWTPSTGNRTAGADVSQA